MRERHREIDINTDRETDLEQETDIERETEKYLFNHRIFFCFSFIKSCYLNWWSLQKCFYIHKVTLSLISLSAVLLSLISTENDPEQHYNHVIVFEAQRCLALYWNDSEHSCDHVAMSIFLHVGDFCCSVWSNMWLWPSLATSRRRNVSSRRQGKKRQQDALLHLLISSGFIIHYWLHRQRNSSA